MPVLYAQEGAVGILALSRSAARNCWGSDYSEGLARELDRLEADANVRAVIITGDEAGRAFSAGADLKNPATHTLETMGDFFTELPKWRSFVVRRLDQFSKPLIAAVNGYAIGIGCILTYCCDLIVASDRAEWRQPQVSLGIIPAYGGSVRLARWIGKGHAMKLSLGFPLDAEEAYRIDLAQWLVPRRADGDGASGGGPDRRDAAAGGAARMSRISSNQVNPSSPRTARRSRRPWRTATAASKKLQPFLTP